MNKPLFQLRPDATVEEVTTYLPVLAEQLNALQCSLFELTAGKKEILENFEHIGGVVAQLSSQQRELQQIADYLSMKRLQVVKP